MKQCLNSIGRDPDHVRESTLVPEDCLVFYDALTSPPKDFCILEYVPFRGYHLETIEATPSFPIKALSYTYPPKFFPDDAALWLFRLTGGDIALLDRFAEFLARAARPKYNGKNITVLCSGKNQQALLDLLYAILFPLVPYEDSDKDVKSLPSLNKICRPSLLQQLFINQETGNGVVFVRSTGVSDAARPVLKKLLTGQMISINVRGYPKQYFYNKTHIICICDDPQEALQLSKSLKGSLIDFSEKELPISYSAADLSNQCIHWLRNVFLPYGLVQTKPTPKTEAPKTPSSDWVDTFLNDCCEISRDALCSKEDFYAAYCECYQAAHRGKEPPLTLGRFAKAVKQRLERGAFLHAQYHKVRKYQKMYFDGIVCVKTADDLHPAPGESPMDQFLPYLQYINQTRPNWSSIYHRIQPQLPGSKDNP